MEKAQNVYFSNYKVDITTIYSTPSLSMKIFKLNFLSEPIPILDKSQDDFIRKSYFGGATDYYQKQGTNLYYYDVNSLYPYAMLKPMPFQMVKIHKELATLEGFFGFCSVKVECPINIKPILPLKHKFKTIFPTGK